MDTFLEFSVGSLFGVFIQKIIFSILTSNNSRNKLLYLLYFIIGILTAFHKWTYIAGIFFTIGISGGDILWKEKKYAPSLSITSMCFACICMIFGNGFIVSILGILFSGLSLLIVKFDKQLDFFVSLFE